MRFLQHQTGRNQITWENLVHLAQMVLLSHLPGPGLCNVFDGVEAASVLQSSVLSRLAEKRESMRDVKFFIKSAFPDFMFPMLRALPLAWMQSGRWLFSSSFYQICPWLRQLRHKDRPDKKQHGSLVIIYPSTRCKNMIHDGRGSFLGKSRFNWSAGVEELLTMFYINGSVQWNKCQRGKGGQARMDRWHALLLHSISLYPWSVSILIICHFRPGSFEAIQQEAFQTHDLKLANIKCDSFFPRRLTSNSIDVNLRIVKSVDPKAQFAAVHVASYKLCNKVN